jgi:transposase
VQGKKDYQEKLFTSFQLSEYVPKENFYRRLKGILELAYLYKATKHYYGDCGQKSIDPVVFFKLCLVGYLENLISDRRLIAHCKMRLDIRFFLGYDLDEELPWHSTLSRTRQLYPQEVFEGVFTQVLSQCVEAGLVSGRTQVVDSAPVKANASMDSLELKVPEQELDAYLREVRHISSMDKQAKPTRKAKKNKAPNEQQQLTASKKELQDISSRNKKWSKDQDQRPGAGNKGSKPACRRGRYTSNKTHYSPTDPDARISVKPGKARKLNYQSQLVVDTSTHIITDIQAYHADKKDNQYLQDITNRVKQRLWRQGLMMENLLADAGYSSGENYAFLEKQGITSYIPQHGTYKGGPEGFIYQKDRDSYLCPQGKEIPYKKTFYETRRGTKKKEYRASKKVCIDCPMRTTCLGKSAQEKKFTITYYRDAYERNNTRVNSKRGKYMKRKRMSTVEPVFGILTQFMGMRKVNTRGIKQANKCMHLAAIAYNLKKLLKHTKPKAESGQGVGEVLHFIKSVLEQLFRADITTPKLTVAIR